MNDKLQIFLILSLLLFLALILYFLSRKKMNVKYALAWLLMDLGMLLVAVFPGIIYAFGRAVGILTPVNTTFLFAGIFALMIIMTLTIIVTQLNNHLYRLTQKMALLEKRVRELEKDEVLGQNTSE